MVLDTALPDLPGDTPEDADRADATPPAAAPTSGRAVVAAVHQALDQAVAADLESDPSAQGEIVAELARAESRLAALRLRVLQAAERDRTARRDGMAGTDQWYAQRTRSDRQQASRDVDLARGLTDRPATRDALANGEISPDHARVIARTEKQLPQGTTSEDRDRVERRLVRQATQMSPGALRRAARRAIAEIEPDRATVDAHEDDRLRSEERRAREATRLVLHDNNDGTVTGRFTLPTFHGHLLSKVIQSMTAPRRARSRAAGDANADNREQDATAAGDGQDATADGDRRDATANGARRSTSARGQSPDGETDWARARGEAFCALLEHMPTDQLHGKTAATVVVTLDHEVLQGQLRAAGVDTDHEISSGEARRLACSAGVLPAVLGGASQPLDLGRTRRLFTETQRIAVGLRHHHCAADGCERPFSWCELHHRHPWSAGGLTDLGEAVPLCHFHHQRIHDPTFTYREHADGSVTFAPGSAA